MDLTDEESNKQQNHYGSGTARRHETGKVLAVKKVVDEEVRESSYHRMLSIVSLVMSAALLTLSINHVSKEFFLAASAAKAARSTIVPSRSRSNNSTASATPDVIATFGINNTTPIPTPNAVSGNLTVNSSSVSSEKTKRKAGSRSVGGMYPKYTPPTRTNPNREIHSIHSTAVTGAEYTSCKMCETNAECTGPKKCIKRRCVENEDELAVCIRNTRQQCGDCVSDGDCRVGLCRSHVCAESVRELHICKLLLTSYLHPSTAGNEGHSSKTHEEYMPNNGVDKCLTCDGGDDLSKNEHKKTKDSGNNKTKRSTKRQNCREIDGVNLKCCDGKCHAGIRHVRRNVKSAAGSKKRIDDARKEVDFKVNGMAISIEEEEALRIHEQCMISCNEKCRSRKNSQDAEKTEEGNHLRNNVKPRRPDATVEKPTLATAKPSEEVTIVTDPSPESAQCKNIKPIPVQPREKDIEKVADQEDEDQNEGDSDTDDVDRFEWHKDDDDFGEQDAEYGDGYDDIYNAEYKGEYEEEYVEDEDDEDYGYDTTDDDDDDLIDDDVDVNDDDDYLAGDGYYEGVDGKFYDDHSENEPEKMLSPEALEIMKMYGIRPQHLEPLLHGRNPKPAGKRKANQAKFRKY